YPGVGEGLPAAQQAAVIGPRPQPDNLADATVRQRAGQDCRPTGATGKMPGGSSRRYAVRAAQHDIGVVEQVPHNVSMVDDVETERLDGRIGAAFREMLTQPIDLVLADV